MPLTKFIEDFNLKWFTAAFHPMGELGKCLNLTRIMLSSNHLQPLNPEPLNLEPTSLNIHAR